MEKKEQVKEVLKETPDSMRKFTYDESDSDEGIV